MDFNKLDKIAIALNDAGVQNEAARRHFLQSLGGHDGLRQFADKMKSLLSPDRQLDMEKVRALPEKEQMIMAGAGMVYLSNLLISEALHVMSKSKQG